MGGAISGTDQSYMAKEHHEGRHSKTASTVSPHHNPSQGCQQQVLSAAVILSSLGLLWETLDVVQMLPMCTGHCSSALGRAVHVPPDSEEIHLLICPEQGVRLPPKRGISTPISCKSGYPVIALQ